MLQKITRALFMACALSAAALPLNAQIPTGGFQLGDLYEYSTSAAYSGVLNTNFAGIIRIDAATGSPSVLKVIPGFNSVLSNIAYDSFRDRLLFMYDDLNTSTPTGITAIDAVGNETLIPTSSIVYSMIAPAATGNVYLMRNLGGGPNPWRVSYLDVNNVIQPVIDISTSAQFGMGTGFQGNPKMIYEPTTNSLFVAEFQLSSCGPWAVTTVIYKIPLSADGATVTGPIQTTSLCASGQYVSPIGFSRGAGDLLQLTLRGGGNINTHIVQIDPATLNVILFAQYLTSTGPQMSPFAATYSHFYNGVALVDTFGDMLRMAYSSGGIGVLVPAGSTPQVSSTGGSAEIVTITEIDYGNSGLSNYGSSTPGCAGVENLYALSSPKAGTTTFRILCSNVPPSNLGLLLIGDAQDPIGTDIFSIGVPLYIDFFASTELITADMYSNSDGLGGTPPLTIDPSLVGNVYYAQALWYWTTCSLPPLNLSGSNCLMMTIQ